MKFEDYETHCPEGTGEIPTTSIEFVADEVDAPVKLVPENENDVDEEEMLIGENKAPIFKKDGKCYTIEPQVHVKNGKCYKKGPHREHLLFIPREGGGRCSLSATAERTGPDAISICGRTSEAR